MPVFEEPGFARFRFGESYRLSVSVVGDRIIHVKPVGVVSLSVIKQATKMIRRLVAAVVPDGLSYVQIDDFSRLDTSSLAARKYYIEELRARDRLEGVVFCGASPLLALSIKLGRRISAEEHRVLLVDDYPQAVNVALSLLSASSAAAAFTDSDPPYTRRQGWRRAVREVLGRAGAAAALLPRRGAAILSRSPLLTDGVRGGLNPWKEVSWHVTSSRSAPGTIVPRPELDLVLDGLSIRYQIIDGDVLHAHTRGYVSLHHVGPIVERNREAIESVGCETPPYFLLDQSDVSGAGLRARREYTRRMIALHRSHPFRMAVLYTPNRLMRILTELGRTMAPFRVEVAADLGGALRLVERDRRRGAAAGGSTSSDRSGAYLDDLLRIMASIDWEREGLGPEVPRISSDHPLKQAFEAIEVLKMDVDQLLLQRKEGAAALGKSERLLRAVIDAANEAIISVDRHGQIDLFSASAEAMFGRPAAVTRGTSFESCLTASSRDRWGDLLSHHFSGAGAGGELVEFDGLRADGSTFPLELSLSSAVTRGRRYTIAVGRDLTEVKRAASEKAQLEHRLHHSQRIRSLGTLSGGIAHDFNNLLMAIQGNLSFLSSGANLQGEEVEAVETIEGLIRSGATLTGQLLACARKGKYEVQPLDLNTIVEQIGQTFWRTHKDIRVNMDLAPGLPALAADRSQVEQVILNLGLNASDAMPGGGDLTFTTRVASPHELPVEVAAASRSYLLLMVRDTGHGISPDAQEQIFEPFFTTKEMGHGTGLGLASVYGSVKGHGGTITVQSEVGVGTTFKVFFPDTGAPAAACSPPEVPAAAVGGTLLVVDDEPLVREAFARMLRSRDYHVLTVGGGEDAIELYRARQYQIDLVILDMIMPDMGGGEVFDQLRGMDPGVKVLLSSGYSKDGAARQILDRGCDGFIQKPFDAEQIITQISEILDPESE